MWVSIGGWRSPSPFFLSLHGLKLGLQRFLFFNKVWAVALCSKGSCCSILRSFSIALGHSLDSVNMAIPAHVYHAGVLPGLQQVLGSLWAVAGLVQTAQHASVAEWLTFVL